MQLLNIALVLLCCCAGVAHGQAKGADCTTTCDADLVCQKGKCRVKIGDACTASSTEDCVVTTADCPANAPLTCACPTGTTANSDKTECTCDDATKVVKADKTCGLKVGETGCGGVEVCLDDAACSSGTCVCNANFVASSDKTKCLLMAGQTGCDTKTCLDNADCTSNTCRCSANFVASDDNTKCLKKADQPCTLDADCLISATCTGSPKKCTCPIGANNDKTKCRKKAEQSCTVADDCLTSATCEGDPKICTCPYRANGDKTKCRVKIGETCKASSTDECVVTAADCPASGTLKCACPADTTANTKKTECICNDNKKALKADKTCGLKVDETGCGGDGECLDDATCSSGTCVCNANYVAISDKTKCLKKADQPCNDATECLTGAICEGNPNKICTCPKGANDDKTKCSGASAVMASLTLLLAALVVSLRM